MNDFGVSSNRRAPVGVFPATRDTSSDLRVGPRDGAVPAGQARVRGRLRGAAAAGPHWNGIRKQ